MTRKLVQFNKWKIYPRKSNQQLKFDATVSSCPSGKRA